MFEGFESALSLWRAKAGDRPFPRWADFDIADFAGWYGWVSLGRLEPHDRDVFVEMYGSEIAQMVGFELTGKSLRASGAGISEQFAESLFSHFTAVLDGPGIGTRVYSLESMKRGHIAARSIDLPISKGGPDATHILCFSKRIKPDEVYR